jgi:enamine deaminase RidA (YjgF/YER057c/UK114 family)
MPPPPPSVANYLGATQVGNIVYLAGHGPWRGDQFTFIGKLGREFDVPTGREAAELVALNCLATLQALIGDLDRVRRVVKLFGMVNSMPDFTHQPKVIDGASELLERVFGPEIGRHARSAVGMAALPAGISVELEMIVEID